MPPVLTTQAADLPALAEALDDNRLLVLSLCAAWCDTCADFRSTLERLAAARPDVRFVWLDVEDDAELTGDIDVENFPTLAIYRRGVLLHYGVSLPTEGIVGRLIDALSEKSRMPDGGAYSPEGAEILDLPDLLRRHLGSLGRDGRQN